MRDMAAIIVDSSRILAEALPLLRSIHSNAARLHELTEAPGAHGRPGRQDP
jgi:hypothetical protein